MEVFSFKQTCGCFDFITNFFLLRPKRSNEAKANPNAPRVLPAWVETVLVAFVVVENHFKANIPVRKVATLARWPECRPEAIRHS